MRRSEVGREELLRELLLWHRRKLTRAMVGLPDMPRLRERNHLSQADVAEMTGLGIGVIQRLESGRGRPDPDVLDRVAVALRMYPDERRVLYELALGHPPPVSAFATDADPGLMLYVRRFNGPALAVDAVFTVLSCNELARLWLPGCGTATNGNFARWLLLDPHAPHAVVDWELIATRVVSRLREVAARFGADPRVTELIGLIRESERVDAMWRSEPGLYHVPMVENVRLRRPGHTDSAQPDDEAHRVPTMMVTLNSPRLDDERRVIAFALEDEADLGVAGGKVVCDACAR
jgi:transcriptional regulator with XRE-family HTH domain